jgi:hypothetical protein
LKRESRYSQTCHLNFFARGITIAVPIKEFKHSRDLFGAEKSGHITLEEIIGTRFSKRVEDAASKLEIDRE